jgi:hypothetical protein
MKIKKQFKGAKFFAPLNRRDYRKPIVTKYHEAMLAKYPRAIAGIHFMCDMNV